MRITKLEIEGFRAYRKRIELDCSGDSVIVVGPNGFGKTSFFDAVGWGLFGRIRRLTGSRDAVGDDYIRNRFVKNGRVEVRLYMSHGEQEVLVERSMNSHTESELHVVVNGTELGVREASRWIGRLFTRPDQMASAPQREVERLFERCVLLPQEQLTAFIRETSPRDRFDALATLLGVDVARDFYTHLSAHEVTTREEVESLESDLRLADQDIERLRVERQALEERTTGESRTLPSLRSDLRRTIEDARESVDIPTDISSRDSADELVEAADLTETKLVGSIAVLEDRLNTLEELQTLRPELPSVERRITRLSRSIKELEEELESNTSGLEADRLALEALGREAAQLRREENAALAEHQELAEFLTLAQSHVTGDRCPVCEQKIDAGQVLARLQMRIDEFPAVSADLAKRQESVRRRTRRLESQIDQKATTVQAVAESLDAKRQEHARASQRSRAATRLAESAGVEIDISSESSIHEAETLTASRLRELSRIRNEIVGLRAQAEFVAARSRLREVRGKLRALASQRRRLVETLSSSRRVDREFSKIIRDSKRAEIDLVKELLGRQGPLLNALYRRLHPHPILDQLEIDYKRFADRGEVYFYATAESGRANVNTIFSSAQLNAVATCLFLSLNLSHFGRNYSLALLDDPIQNMDDFNVVGLLDMLRSFVPLRQVFISTHDAMLGQLISRKLRPTRPGERTLVHNLNGYDIDGPHVVTDIHDYSEEPWIINEIAS